MVELSHHRFPSIGSILLSSLSPTSSTSTAPTLGPLTLPTFYTEGRSSLPDLDRGPFLTARAYFLACAQRELDSARALFTQGASEDYLRDLQEGQLQVERSVGLIVDLIKRCQGLDEDDAELGAFTLDMHEVALKNIYVDEETQSKIVRTLTFPSYSSPQTNVLMRLRFASPTGNRP